MTAAVIAYDDVDLSLIPSDAQVIFFYTDGIYKETSTIAARFPHATLIGIAVRSADKADVLDVEPGDAANVDVYWWLKSLPKPWKGVTRCPVIYTSASNVDALMQTMNANGFKHGVDFLLWSAHYTGQAHLCGPATCKACNVAVDATQWTDRAAGKSLDESLLGSAFLASTVAPSPVQTPPTPTPTPAKPNVIIQLGNTRIELTPGRTYTFTVSD